mgnify:CR=1 FL=1
MFGYGKPHSPYARGGGAGRTTQPAPGAWTRFYRALAQKSEQRDELKAAIDAGATMLLIDVREDYEVESGPIPGSIHIPLGQLEDRMSDIPHDVRLVFF